MAFLRRAQPTPQDDLSLAHARQVKDQRQIELDRAQTLLKQVTASPVPDRCCTEFQEHAREARDRLAEAEHQVVVRGRSVARRRTVRAAGRVAQFGFVIPATAAAGLAQLAGETAEVASACSGMTGLVWVLCSAFAWADGASLRTIRPLESQSVPAPELPPEVTGGPVFLTAPAADAGATPDRWTAAERHARVEADWVAFECSPVRVFQTPALADIRHPDTAAFHDALAAAGTARTRVGAGTAVHAEWAEAVDRLERAWTVARTTAEVVGRRSATEAEHGRDPAPARDERLRTALACARVVEDEAATVPERQTAFDAMLRHADGLMPVPAKVREMLALPAGASS